MNLSGGSVAGVQTCIEVPHLGLLLDIGSCTKSAVGQSTGLISHGHLDHIGAITLHAARRSLMNMREGTYVIPRQIAPQVEAFFAAAGELDGQVIPRRLVPLAPGEEFALDAKRFVRPFRTFHRVPSQGYTVWERRHRLRGDLRGKPREELTALRAQGISLDEPYEAPILSFTGDTRAEVLEQVPELGVTETLVIESTFLDGRVTPAQSREMGHIHLDDLLARAELLTAKSIVLHHFSARYTRGEIERLIETRLPDALRERTSVFAASASASASRAAPAGSSG